MSSSTQSVNNKIAHSDASKELKTIKRRIATLEQEYEALVVKRDSLEKQILLLQDTAPKTAVTLSKRQKIELFKRLFKGRSDVYAGRWGNSQGRSGYSIACHNEWVPGTCNKPRIKCSECLHQKYKVLDDHAIYTHLTGKRLLVYTRFLLTIPATYWQWILTKPTGVIL